LAFNDIDVDGASARARLLETDGSLGRGGSFGNSGPLGGGDSSGLRGVLRFDTKADAVRFLARAIRKLWGENFLRVLRELERVAHPR
jgi:hypothetical protein